MRTKKPLVSVVIPVYNQELYIKECLQSVLGQTGRGTSFDLEVIIIDDGSIDDTAQLVKAFGSEVQYVLIPNSGRPSVPRNIGISRAKGEYIAFQDSDDIWLKDRILTSLSLMRDEIILVSGNAKKISSDGKLLGKSILPVDEEHHGDVLTSLVNINHICTLTVLVRKQAIQDAGGFDERLELRGVEDYELWLRLAARGNFAYSPRPIAKYRVHEENLTNHDKLGAVGALRLGYEAIYSAYKKGGFKRMYHLPYLEKLTGITMGLAAKSNPSSTFFLYQNIKFRILYKYYRVISRLFKVQ